MLFSCNSNTLVKESTPEIASYNIGKDTGANYFYNLKSPKRQWKLPPVLVEVSGNTWIDKDHLILIEDFSANIYYIKIDDSTAILEKTIPFTNNSKFKFDIEDVTSVNGIVYALWSHGDLFKITNWQTNPNVKRIRTRLDKGNNTEGLCYDPVTKMLLIACKDDPGIRDVKRSTKAIYQFDMISNKLVDQPFLLINKKDFLSVVGEEISFNPSAIAVHPITHDIYILTTRDNKGMAVFSYNGVLKSYQPIDKEEMPQPEGICFSPEGILYISSEGKKGESGYLFEFESTSQQLKN